MADLEIAVLICSAKSDDEVITKLHAQELSLFSRWKQALWRRVNRGRNVKAEVGKFLAYQDDYLSIPEIRDAEGETDCKLPWILMHAATLIGHTGWSEEAVFNMPIGKVLWLNLAFAYGKTGKTNVVSEREMQAQAAIQALTAGG